MNASPFIAGMLAGAVVALATASIVVNRDIPPTALEQHFSPAENLERIDVALIDSAARTLDMAAYVLTDRPVIEALARAGRRGVRVRLFRQPQDYEARGVVAEALADLEPAGVTIRFQDPGKPLMHLKAYCVDGSTLRVGAANFSASGLKHQANDLEIIRGETACAGFDRTFAKLWEEK